MALYAVVIGIFVGFLQWETDTQSTILNNDTVLWSCFGFGLAYWTIVAIMVCTGTRASFDAAIDEEDMKTA